MTILQKNEHKYVAKQHYFLLISILNARNSEQNIQYKKV